MRKKRTSRRFSDWKAELLKDVEPWDVKCKRLAMELTREKRQEFLDAFRSGLSVGEAYEKVGISFDEANGIMMLNIYQAHFLRTESV